MLLLQPIQKTDDTEGEWYTPAFLGNREKPIGKRAEFQLLPLSKKEKDGLERTVATNSRSRDVMKIAEDRQKAKTKKAIEERVIGFRNVFYQDESGAQVEVKDAKEFLRVLDMLDSATAEEIIDELIAAITDASVLEAGILGNLS